MPAHGENWEVDCEQVIFYGYLHIADVLFEEVEGQLVFEVLEILHEWPCIVNQRYDLQHENGNVEAFLQDQGIGLMFGVLFIPDHFEDLVLGHFLNVFLELHPAECVEDTP